MHARKPSKPKPRPRPYRKPWMLGAILLALNSFGCAPSLKQAPMQGEMLSVDLTDAQCQSLGPDPHADGFEVYLCATTVRVDRPHMNRGEIHSPLVFVRVPDDNASAFAKAHPVPAERRRNEPIQESL